MWEPKKSRCACGDAGRAQGRGQGRASRWRHARLWRLGRTAAAHLRPVHPGQPALQALPCPQLREQTASCGEQHPRPGTPRAAGTATASPGPGWRAAGRVGRCQSRRARTSCRARRCRRPPPAAPRAATPPACTMRDASGGRDRGQLSQAGPGKSPWLPRNTLKYDQHVNAWACRACATGQPALVRADEPAKGGGGRTARTGPLQTRGPPAGWAAPGCAGTPA